MLIGIFVILVFPVVIGWVFGQKHEHLPQYDIIEDWAKYPV